MEMIRLAHEALASIARSPKLFVAWIAGHALGGGLEIALACDLRYAAEGSYRLGTPEVTLGLLPGNGGTQRLPRIIGRGPALELLLTGRQVTPDEAQRLGIVGGLFDGDDAFDAHAERLAAGPPLAIANIKRAVHQGLERHARGGPDARARARRAAVPLAGRQRGPDGLHREAGAELPGRVSLTSPRSELARTEAEPLASSAASSSTAPSSPSRARRSRSRTRRRARPSAGPRTPTPPPSTAPSARPTPRRATGRGAATPTAAPCSTRAPRRSSSTSTS